MLVLNPVDYDRVGHLVQNIPFNTFFAGMVTRKRLRGTIYVNNAANPESCLIFHHYGMLLLCGRTDETDFNARVKDILLHTRYDRPLWLQVYPPEWSGLLQSLLGNRLARYPQDSDHLKAESEFNRLTRKNVIQCTRVNFAFNQDKYLLSPKPEIPRALKIIRANRKLFQGLHGVVVPKYFWDSYEDFARCGAGFSVLEGETILSTCFSAFVIDNHFEIGIETNPDHRGKGHAELAARACIDYCLAHGYDPVWACRKENLASYRLAQKLGFEVTGELPYYCLVDNHE